MALLISSHFSSAFSAIAGSRESNSIVLRQDEEGGEPDSSGGGESGSESGGEEVTTPDPETVKGVDRFVYGFNALVKGIGVFFTIIDKKVERKVMTLEEFLNIIHDLVHIEGTDYHETAYITEKQKK